MKVLRHLNRASHGMTAVYKIVFTSLLLYELIKFRWGKRNAESYSDHHRYRDR